MSQNPIFNPREEAVIDHLMQGESNKQIALALGVSTRTVKFHLGKVYAKLGVASRGEAILKLSAPPFAESTAEAHSSEWRQSTVDSTHPASENQNEKPTFTWRVPMKKIPLPLGRAACPSGNCIHYCRQTLSRTKAQINRWRQACQLLPLQLLRLSPRCFQPEARS